MSPADSLPDPADRDLDDDGPGVELGAIAYGCWRFAGTSVAEARAKVETALEFDMTLIDTADIYGWRTEEGFGAAEALLGRVLAEAPHLRDGMILATKGGIQPPKPYDSSAGYLTEACEASLRRLGVDVIDVYQVHRPDLLAHPGEVGETLTALRDDGKVREVGISNHTVAQARALQAYLDFPIATSQPELSPLRLDPLVDGTLDLCMELGMAPLAWSPLAGGRLAGEPPAGDLRAEAVCAVCDRIADEQGVSRSAVVLAWLMAHPSGVVPIIGTQQLDRIRECARATEVEFTRELWYEVLVAARGEAMP